jgi:hypothetical protein
MASPDILAMTGTGAVPVTALQQIGAGVSLVQQQGMSLSLSPH